MPLVTRIKNIYGLGVVTWTVCKILDILTFSPYKCLSYQIWPWPKIGQGHPRVGHHLNKLWWARVPDATYQVSWKSAQRFQRRRFLKGFHHIWAWRASWSCDLDPANKLPFPHPMEAPHEIWLQSAQRFRRRRLKMLTDKQTYRQRPCHMISSPMSLRLRRAKMHVLICLSN